MAEQQQDMKIPTDLIPYCPHCGAPMTVNLRIDGTFVQDNGWYKASERYSDFLRRYDNLHVLYLELGVGNNTPGIIKYPFQQMTAQNFKAVYACLNLKDVGVPQEIAKRSVCIEGDIGEALAEACYLDVSVKCAKCSE